MRGPGFFDRRIRGFRVVELGAAGVLLVLVLVVYLAKTGASGKREDIDRIDEQIVAEQTQIRLLNAEIANQERPDRLEALASRYLGLQPVAPKHELSLDALPPIASLAAPVPSATTLPATTPPVAAAPAVDAGSGR